MPKRLVDGDAIWASEKLSKIPERHVAQYAWCIISSANQWQMLNVGLYGFVRLRPCDADIETVDFKRDKEDAEKDGGNNGQA